MNISLKELIGKRVYKNENDEPWGVIKSVGFANSGDRISSVKIETLSLIPVSTDVLIEEIAENRDKKLILKSEKSIGKINRALINKNVLKAVCSNGKSRKIKDMRFEFETGEITDIVIQNGAFRKGEKICVNKMHIKDNTIYIE